jgi:hypothetical protein
MPTPFYHLSLAEELLTHPSLPEPIRQLLQKRRCEFMFGNTAPDVQVVSGQSRLETHFFNLPILADDRPAWEGLFIEFPQLAVFGKLPVAQVAFLAGYVCHIQADWLWQIDIFGPFFGPRCTWETFRQRLYYHNVLRAYLDMQILSELPKGMDVCLNQVEPNSWLPFVANRYLVEWRDWLYPQLQPGAAIQTVEVFSSRQGISPPEFYKLMRSETNMQHEIFTHFPLELVNIYRQHVLDENIHMLSDSMAFTLHPMDTPNKGKLYQGVQS